MWKKRLAYAALTLSSVVILVACVGFARFRAHETKRHSVPGPKLAAASGAAALERGGHLVNGIAGCRECHGDNLRGRVMEDGPLLRLVAPNLTPGRGSSVQGYSDADWARAILHGVNREGRALLIMPTSSLRTFSRSDVEAMIAYLRTLPATDSALPTSRVKLLGKLVFGWAGAELWPAEDVDHQQEHHVVAPPVGATPAYGKYLLGVCRGCHGPELKGGLQQGPDAPPSADISRASMLAWRYEEFERLARSGKRRDGSELHPMMPWRVLRDLKEEELQALWLALKTE